MSSVELTVIRLGSQLHRNLAGGSSEFKFDSASADSKLANYLSRDVLGILPEPMGKMVF